jgi:hypothetical protein
MARYSDNGRIRRVKAAIWRKMCQCRGRAVSIDELISAVYDDNEPVDAEQCISRAINQLVHDLVQCGWSVRLRVLRARGRSRTMYEIVDVEDEDAADEGPIVRGRGAGVRRHRSAHRVAAPSRFGSVVPAA